MPNAHATMSKRRGQVKPINVQCTVYGITVFTDLR